MLARRDDRAEGALLGTIVMVGITVFLALTVKLPTEPWSFETPAVAGCARSTDAHGHGLPEEERAWAWYDSRDRAAASEARLWCKGARPLTYDPEDVFEEAGKMCVPIHRDVEAGRTLLFACWPPGTMNESLDIVPNPPQPDTNLSGSKTWTAP